MVGFLLGTRGHRGVHEGSRASSGVSLGRQGPPTMVQPRGTQGGTGQWQGQGQRWGQAPPPPGQGSPPGAAAHLSIS